MTLEAQEEVVRLKKEADYVDEQANKMRLAGYNSEARSLTGKWARLYDKYSSIEKLGISSNEKKAVLLSLPGMTAISSSRDLGSSGAVKVGFVNKLGIYVKVSYTKFSSFMRNVRGCSSLAGKVDINSIEVISKEVYDNIVAGIAGAGGHKHEVNFMGAHQESRGGKIITNEKSENTSIPW